MRTSAHRRPSDARRRVAGFALWRAVTAAPPALGSLLLVLVSAGLGRWAALLLLAWAAGAAVLMTPVGERITVRTVCRFHRPSPRRAAALQPAWWTALGVTGTATGDVQL